MPKKGRILVLFIFLDERTKLVLLFCIDGASNSLNVSNQSWQNKIVLYTDGVSNAVGIHFLYQESAVGRVTIVMWQEKN